MTKNKLKSKEAVETVETAPAPLMEQWQAAVEGSSGGSDAAAAMIDPVRPIATLIEFYLIKTREKRRERSLVFNH